MSLGTDYIVRYLSDISGAVKGAKELETVNANMAKNVQDQYGQVTKIIGNLSPKIKEIPIRADGKDAIKTIQTVGQVVQTSNGTFLEMSKTLSTFNNKTVITSTSVKDVTNQFVKTNLEAAKGNKIFTNLTDNIKQLAGRAILTIPIWIALRGAIMGSFQAIGDGVKNLIAFDLALQKIRNNLSGTPEAVAASFKKIKDSITETSKATGISTEELAGAVKQFATLGFSANESLQGALGASKLSIALFGDASDTAGAFAKALNILIDRSKGAKSGADQMNEAFALTSQLEETNNFEIKGVTEALNKFAGTAAGVGLTMNETLQILAALGTAGRTGSEGATLLSTSFNTLLKNLPQLSKSLGIVVGAGESTFQTFTKILNKITELNQTPGGRNAAIEGISEIFGGARGIKIVQSLIAVKNILDANVAILPNYNALNEKVRRTLESESGQAKILGNNLKETGKAFVTAIIGSEDFTSSLIKLNKVVGQVGEGLKPLGSTVHAIFSNLGLIAGATFILNFSKIVTTEALLARILTAQAAFDIMGVKLAFIFSRGFLVGLKTIGKLAMGSLALGFTGASTGAVIAGMAKFLLSPVTIIATVVGKIAADALTENFINGIKSKNTKAQNAFNQLIGGLRGDLAIPDLTSLIEKMTLELKPGDLITAREIGVLRKRLKDQIETTPLDAKIQTNVAPIISFADQQTIAKQILEFKLNEIKLQDATNVQLLIAKQLYIDQLGIVEDNVEKSARGLALAAAMSEEAKHLNNMQKEGLIANQLNFLKLLGATNLELLQQQIAYEKIFNINQTTDDLLKNRLELSKAITEEEISLDNIQRKGLIDNQLEILRLQGATNLQLVQQRIELERMYGVDQNREEFLRNELELNQEITKEKLNQNKVSSDSVKLFQIAQKFGIQTATTVAGFISGKTPIAPFEKGGGLSDLMPILQEFFAAEVEQRQAQEFFFKGLGSTIPIPERRAIQEFQPTQLAQFKLPDINTQVGQINIDVKKVFKEEETAKQIMDAILEAIRNNPTIETAINEKIDAF